MRNRQLSILFFLFSVSGLGIAQVDTLPLCGDTAKSYLLHVVDRDGESLPEVEIKEVTVIAGTNKKQNKKQNKRQTQRQYRYHSRLVYNLKTVYPYSVIVREEFAGVNDTLGMLSTDREKRQYLRNFEKRLFRQYEGDLRKMTVTQGKLLIKLVDRETQNTSYDLIKLYRGGFSAFFWQGIAKIFGSNLKATYDPYGEDALIEIILRDIEAGYL